MNALAPAVAAVLVTLPPLFPAGASPEATARTRQWAARSFDIRLRRTEFIAKCGISAAQHGIPKPVVPIPPRETVLESVNRLVVDGVQVRWEDNHPHATAAEPTKVAWVSVYDGAEAKLFHPG